MMNLARIQEKCEACEVSFEVINEVLDVNTVEDEANNIREVGVDDMEVDFEDKEESPRNKDAARVNNKGSVDNTVEDDTNPDKGFDASPCRDDLAHGKPDRPSREQVYGEPDMPYPVPAPYLSPAQGEPAGPCLERVYGEPVCDKPSPVPAPCPTPAQGDPDRPCLEQVYGHPELLPMPQPQTDPVQTCRFMGVIASPNSRSSKERY